MCKEPKGRKQFKTKSGMVGDLMLVWNPQMFYWSK